MAKDKIQAWAVGDPCPACGDTLSPYRAATDAEYAASIDRENPKLLPSRVDTAAPAAVLELGALHVCDGCGYQARVAPDAEPEVKASKGKRAGSSTE